MAKQYEFDRPPLSYWIASTEATDYPPLEDEMEADVAIIGGGISGITAAYLLKKEGLRVAVIEADRISKATTGNTTAKVTSQHALIYDKIISKMGREMAQQYADANESAIGLVKQLADEAGIKCDYEPQQAFVLATEESYIKKVQDEARAAEELGIKAKYLDTVDLPIKVLGALRFEGQAQFHPRKYVLGLAAKIPGSGSYIFENTRALDIEKSANGLRVLTNRNGKVKANYAVVASHYPFFDGNGLYFTRIFPHRSYILGVKIKDEFPGGMYITAEDPGRSLRYALTDEGKLLLVAGEHHKTGQGEDMINHYYKLADFARQNFTVEDIPYRWSTQDYTTMDEVPYAGPISSAFPNIFVATGFRKWGMTNSTVSAVIIKDLIAKGDNPWAPVYSPSRFTPVASAPKFISENANTAAELIKGKLSGAPDELDVEPGQGKVVEIDGEKTGVYKDEKGTIHMVSNTCAHIGCQLSWNSAEHTWDCPCHGSRFTYEGEIIEGPAQKTIKKELR